MQRVLTVLFLAQIAGIVLGVSEPCCKCNYCDGKLELGIVLDTSSSIERDDFKRGQQFLKDYLKNFNINQNGVRVSIIPYSSEPHSDVAFYLNTYNNGDDVAEAIGNIQHKEGNSTETGKGIRFMRKRQLHRWFTRNGVPRVSVVITDGNSQEQAKTAEEARKAREDGITMFAVGVGHKIDENELKNIAGQSDRVFKVDSYGILATITERLAKQTCVKQCF